MNKAEWGKKMQLLRVERVRLYSVVEQVITRKRVYMR